MKAHAALLLVVSFVLQPGVGHATWQPNGNGVAIAPEDQTMPQVIPDGTGGTIITWSDNRNGSWDIYAQRLNGLGVAQWAPNGVLLCDAPGDQISPQIVTDGIGGAIVVWLDSRSGSIRDLEAQRVNASGVVQWPLAGVRLSLPSPKGALRACPDGAGGALVAWTDTRDITSTTPSDIYAQRINGDGSLHWTSEGYPVRTGYGVQDHPTIVSDGTGGAILAWEDPHGLIPDIDVYASRLDGPDGSPLWSGIGLPVCAAGGDQLNPEIVLDGSSGVIVAWDDRRSGADIDIYAQRLNAAGAPQWTLNGVAVCAAPGYQVAPALVSSAGGAIVAWTDQRSDPGDIFAQRLNASGVAQWSFNGVPLCMAPGDQSFYPRDPAIATDGAGGAFVTWQDMRTGTTDIYAQHVNFNGSVQLTPSGATLCTIGGAQDRPTITYTGPFGDAVVVWQDERNESSGVHDVYATPIPNTPISPFDRVVPYPNGIIIAPDPHIWPVHLLFHNVITAGFTYLDITPAGPALPPSFVLGDGRYYNLSTTAGTTDNIDVCIKFDPAALQHPAAALRMFQYNIAGPAGPTWLDITTGAAAGDSICGATTSLTTFVIGFPSVTGVGDTPAPASFALHANVPNPFNPITTISYDVPAGGAHVNITVYDITGRRVRALVDQYRPAGVFSAQWNGDNDRGETVTSGVYFYRMRAGAFVDTKKMVLLK